MMTFRFVPGALALICLVGSCSGGGSPSLSPPTPVSSPAPKSHGGILSPGDMRTFSNLYDAMLALRRNWFMARGNDAAHQPMVYVDGVLTAGVGVLAGIRPELVVEVRYLPAIDAMGRFGPSHGGGAILIVTNR